ncbi:MAG: SPOR domain-containing protein [Candidatus Thiodiazotropha sp.]|jgi:cell division protein FtsN
MTDYKHRAGGKKQRSNNSCSCSIYLVGGLVVGAFLVGLAWLKVGPNLSHGGIPGVNSRHQPKPTREEPSPAPPKPTFEFYTILPEMEVVVPDEKIIPPEKPQRPSQPVKERTKPATSQPQQDKGSYILQMGSFRKYQDADRLKAKLALIGIEAEIQKVSINNRETYHRVRSGPYHSQAQLNNARKLVTQNNITSLVIKLKR